MSKFQETLTKVKDSISNLGIVKKISNSKVWHKFMQKSFFKRVMIVLTTILLISIVFSILSIIFQINRALRIIEMITWLLTWFLESISG